MNDPLIRLDSQLEALTAEIENLAHADLPPPGLEDRIYTTTLPALQQAPKSPLKLVGTPRAWAPRFLSPLRLAASIALLATAGAVWLASSRGGAAADPHPIATADTDDWALVSAMFQDDASEELESLMSDSAGLQDRIKSLSLSELLLEEGSM
jgi:hypothetical protein